VCGRYGDRKLPHSKFITCLSTAQPWSSQSLCSNAQSIGLWKVQQYFLSSFLLVEGLRLPKCCRQCKIDSQWVTPFCVVWNRWQKDCSHEEVQGAKKRTFKQEICMFW
jgi:hypothetical protein